MPQVKWHADQIKRSLKATMRERYAAAAITVANHAKVLIGREGAVMTTTQPTPPGTRHKGKH